MRLALAFLTRLPGGTHARSGHELGRAVPWFPAVGAVVGGLGAVSRAGADLVAGPLTAAVVALAVTAGVTGAFHEDGLADTVDGLAGGADPEERRRILKDSRHGTFGVLALVLVTLAKASTLAELSGRDAAAALIAANTLARAGVVAMVGFAPVAPGDGSGQAVASAVGPRAVASGVAAGWILTLATVVAIGGYDLIGGAGLVLAASAAVVVAAVAVTIWARARIGGVTGDILGAAEQVAEVSILLTVVAWSSPAI